MFVNDGIFVQVVGTGQEDCDRIFLRPMCFEVTSFWTTFHTVLEGTTLGMDSQSTRGPELFFLQVVNFFCFVFLTYVISLKRREKFCRLHAKNKGN